MTTVIPSLEDDTDDRDETSFELCAQDFSILASMMLDFVTPQELRDRLEVEIERHGKMSN